jgi:hypothetical protein
MCTIRRRTEQRANLVVHFNWSAGGITYKVSGSKFIAMRYAEAKSEMSSRS